MTLSVVLSLLGLVMVALLGCVGYLIFRLNHQKQAQLDSQNSYQHFQQRLDQLQNQFRLNLDGNTQILQQQLGLLTKQMDDRLSQGIKTSMESGKNLNERMDQAAKVFGELQNRLGKLSEASEKIFDVGKDIRSLQEILKNPKTRGNMGELFLENLLKEMLPQEHYDLQYSFKSNEKVDAVIHVGESMIPIDAKFPLENFNRIVTTDDETQKSQYKKQFLIDVKKHIDAISKKYILPDQGTFDFAFMYIPAENVFYEMMIQDDSQIQNNSVQSYALKKKVITVSPNSFYSYLAALMHALRGERIQKNIFELVAKIRHLSVDLGRFRDDFEKVGYHLNNLQSSYDAADKRLGRYQDRLGKLQEIDAELEASEKPVKLVAGD